MKTHLLTLVFVLSSVFGFAGEGYEKAMLSAIEKLFRSQTIAEYTEAANQFERISNSEKTEWLPLYYTSYAYIMISFQESDNAKKDQQLDQAQKFLDQAMAINPNESELFLLQGFLYPSRITIDPMNRGMQYFDVMNKALDKALEINPDNPRVFFLRAMMTLNTPENFGGGADKALPLFKMAEEKFSIFVPQSSISPNWGKEANDGELKKLQESVTK